MKLVTLGPLSAILTPDLSNEKVALTVVLLHGFGAPGTDLVGLGSEIDAPPGTRFVFLQAPNLLEPELTEAFSGRAWWNIDMARLQFLRMSGRSAELADQTPDGLSEARAALTLALEALERDYGMQRKRLVVGGFSQGAMLSTDYALRSSDALGGLVILSGTYLARKDWQEAMPRRKGLPIFQSHSPDDVVLPFQLAEALAADLGSAGLPPTFVTFRGGHGIGPTVLSGLSQFLKGLRP